MRIVAMSITNTEWNIITGELLEPTEMSKFVDKLSTNTKLKMKRLEIDTMGHDNTKGATQLISCKHLVTDHKRFGMNGKVV